MCCIEVIFWINQPNDYTVRHSHSSFASNCHYSFPIPVHNLFCCCCWIFRILVFICICHWNRMRTMFSADSHKNGVSRKFKLRQKSKPISYIWWTTKRQQLNEEKTTNNHWILDFAGYSLFCTKLQEFAVECQRLRIFNIRLWFHLNNICESHSIFSRRWTQKTHKPRNNQPLIKRANNFNFAYSVCDRMKEGARHGTPIETHSLCLIYFHAEFHALTFLHAGINFQLVIFA